MTITFTVPDPAEWPVWVYWVCGTLVWYMLAGLVLRNFCSCPSDNPLDVPMLWVMSPVLVGLIVVGFVLLTAAYVLSCGAVRPPWKWSW